jgi:hypothetical protein
MQDDTSRFILVWARENPTSNRGRWDLYYLHLSACSREYKLIGRGKDPKSLRLIEASANVVVEVKTVKCSSVPWSCGLPLFIASRRAARSPGVAAYSEEWSRAPVDGMAWSMGLVLAVDLCPMEIPDFCWDPRARPRAWSRTRAPDKEVAHALVVNAVLNMAKALE